MINVATATKFHELVIVEFGGSAGIRDLNLLESALSRPFHTFDGIDLYPSPYLKASAILESILINHPFIDGNKRTAFLLMALILIENDITLQASQEELYEFIINVIEQRPSIENISLWIRKNSDKNEQTSL
jgi:death-on-curing protein